MSLDFGNFLDRAVMEDYNYFLHKVNERTELQFNLRDSYHDDGHAALGQTVEYFGFNILQDDRMRYIIENIVSLPDSELSQKNKIGNTIISHFYGARGIHTLVTGENDPKKAHFDFERAAVDQDYIDRTAKIVKFYHMHKKRFYGTTELHTSIQTAARNFCREKYNDPTRPASLTDILEWISGWTQDGTMDTILGDTNSLKDMYDVLTSKAGIGEYYGYHCATSNSVNPVLNFNHDDEFNAPGPGARETLNMLFPELKKGKHTWGQLVVWLRDNQDELFEGLNIHSHFHNYTLNDGSKIFSFDQNRMMVYGTEVSLCQYSVYNYLRNNPNLIGRRQIVREETDICPGALMEYIEGRYQFPEKTKKAKKIIVPTTTLF